MNPVVCQVADEETIYHNFKELLENQDAYSAMAKANNPYGDGKACEAIGVRNTKKSIKKI